MVMARITSLMTSIKSGIDNDNSDEDTAILQYYEGSYGACDSDIYIGINNYRAAVQSSRPSFWACLKASVESTVLCGVLIGVFGTFLWWLELNLRMFCFTEWKEVPENIHRTRLIVDIFIATLAQFWVLSCIAPICDWPTIKALSLIYICTIAALLDAVNRLLLFVFAYYSKRWKHYIGCWIFLMTSFTVCYRFARHCKAAGKLHCNVLVLTLKLNLQFMFGLLVAIPFNLVFLDLYYKSSSIEKTIVACVLIIAFAIPKLFINHVATNLHGICTPGDEIVLAVVYLTGSTVISRLMQAKIEKLSYFIVISVVHGLLNIVDKLLLPLRRRILFCLFHCCNERGNHQLTSAKRSLFLANQTLISIITESTCVVICSAAAHLLLYYYKREESTGQRYNGYELLKDMVIRCSIAVGIELIFNVIAVNIQTYLYKIPAIGVWKWKWNSIILIHVIQVLFIVLYFSQFINNVLVKDYYIEANITCFGLFKRV